jgi:hypothetical protein
MSMCITIASIETKPKLSIVNTTNGRKLRCWTNKIGSFGLEAGGTYNVETEELPFGDTPLTGITSAKRVTMPAGSSQSQEPSVSDSPRHNSGASTSSAGQGYYRPTSPEDSERMFVCSLMNAFIQAGKIEPEQGRVIKAVNVLREAYHATFGSDGMRQAAE